MRRVSRLRWRRISPSLPNDLRGNSIGAQGWRIAAALEKNNAGVRVLTVQWSLLQSHKFAITCLDLGGEPLVSVELEPRDGLTNLLAAITSTSMHKGHWRLVLPDGRLLQDFSDTLTLSQVLRPNVPSMSFNEPLGKRQMCV